MLKIGSSDHSLTLFKSGIILSSWKQPPGNEIKIYFKITVSIFSIKFHVNGKSCFQSFFITLTVILNNVTIMFMTQIIVKKIAHNKLCDL